MARRINMTKTLILIVIAVCTTAYTLPPKALTSHGVVVGSKMQAIPTGRTFLAFRGIPYAQPPLGVLRFQAPEPLMPWHGELDATKDAPMCIQKDFLLADPVVEGQEDCLYLNVYTPWLDTSNGNVSLLPVMVYIHGGGFFGGTGSSQVHGPEFFLARDIVLVTFNYRLGAMGFLSSGTAHAPGNAGMKDQVAVLRWVQQNAEAFGGNSKSVTIFGQSAGGASVHHHMMSPMSNGLFHRAIPQSGVSLSVWSWGSLLGPYIAMQQALLVGCPTIPVEDMVKCLQATDATTLVDSTSKFQTWGRDPFVMYSPVIEPPTNSITEERFLTVSPFNNIEQNNVHPVPMMVGTVINEGTVRAGAILKDKALMEDFNSRPEELGPFILGLILSVENGSMETQQAIWANISDFFFQKEQITEKNELQFVEMYGERLFTHAIYHTARMHAALQSSPVYLYKFSYEGMYSFTPLFSHDINTRYGVGHCDDLIYLFSNPSLFPLWPEGHPDHAMRDLMILLWTNFAQYGTPTPVGSELLWLPLSACGPLRFADINAKMTTENTDFFNDRMNFWEQQQLSENSLAAVSRIGVSSQRNCTTSHPRSTSRR